MCVCVCVCGCVREWMRERERVRERDVHIDLNSWQSVLVFDVFVYIECKYVWNWNKKKEKKRDPVTNEEVCAKIQQAIGPHEDLATVKRRKLQWFGHVSRSLGLAKFILQGTVKGGRRQGRRGRGGKTISGNGQAWSSLSPRRQCRTGNNVGNWLQNHLWCPSDPRG